MRFIVEAFDPCAGITAVIEVGVFTTNDVTGTATEPLDTSTESTVEVEKFDPVRTTEFPPAAIPETGRTEVKVGVVPVVADVFE